MARHIPGPLYFDLHGPSGTPMLFLHSTPDDHRLWMYQTARFSSWFRTIAVDLAGYGRSGPRAERRVASSTRPMPRGRSSIRSRRASVIIHGNSMGSMVAMQMASRQPQRVPCLILSGTGYLPTRDAMKVWARRYAEEGLELRYKQCLDHFSPAAQKLPHVQYYARMVCELNNPATVSQHHRDERGAVRRRRAGFVLRHAGDADDHHQRHRRPQPRRGRARSTRTSRGSELPAPSRARATP